MVSIISILVFGVCSVKMTIRGTRKSKRKNEIIRSFTCAEGTIILKNWNFLSISGEC